MAKVTDEQLAQMTGEQLAAHYGVGEDEARFMRHLALTGEGDRQLTNQTPPVDPAVVQRLRLKAAKPH